MQNQITEMKTALIAFAASLAGIVIDEKSLLPIGTCAVIAGFCFWIGFQYKGLKDGMKILKSNQQTMFKLMEHLHCMKGKIIPKECVCDTDDDSVKE